MPTLARQGAYHQSTEEGLPREDGLRGKFDQALDCYG